MRLSYRLAVFSVTFSFLIASGWTGSAPAVQAAPGGEVVARIDVDGDGRRDVVRFRAVDDNRAVVTVATARGTTLRKKLRTLYIEPSWHGAARIDGRRGAELVVLTDAGAHTLFHTVLTVRGGRLVKENAPGRGRTWVTDGAVFVYIGWKRYVRDGRSFVVRRYVTKDFDSDKWSGRAVTYRWRKGHSDWQKVSAGSLHPHTDRRAARFGGWDVRGLPRWP